MAALVAGSCSGADPANRLGPDGIPVSLVDRPITVAEIGELELRVAVADTPESRARGLMDVVDLGALEGMAFVFEAPTTSGFFMKDVAMPLDIAFVGADGSVLDVARMERCTADPCPVYHAPGPFLWALETAAGDLASVRPGHRFVLRAWEQR